MVHLKISTYLRRPLTGKFKIMNNFLTNLWHEMGVVLGPEKIILQKDGKCFFTNDRNLCWSGCYDDRVCSFFTDDMDMDRSETQNFMKCMLENYLKCEIETLTDIEFRTVIIGSYTSEMSTVFPWWGELINNVSHND